MNEQPGVVRSVTILAPSHKKRMARVALSTVSMSRVSSIFDSPMAKVLSTRTHKLSCDVVPPDGSANPERHDNVEHELNPRPEKLSLARTRPTGPAASCGWAPLCMAIRPIDMPGNTEGSRGVGLSGHVLTIFDRHAQEREWAARERSKEVDILGKIVEMGHVLVVQAGASVPAGSRATAGASTAAVTAGSSAATLTAGSRAAALPLNDAGAYNGGRARCSRSRHPHRRAEHRGPGEGRHSGRRDPVAVGSRGRDGGRGSREHNQSLEDQRRRDKRKGCDVRAVLCSNENLERRRWLLTSSGLWRYGRRFPAQKEGKVNR